MLNYTVLQISHDKPFKPSLDDPEREDHLPLYLWDRCCMYSMDIVWIPSKYLPSRDLLKLLGRFVVPTMF
jgi:hypothetical protein